MGAYFILVALFAAICFVYPAFMAVLWFAERRCGSRVKFRDYINF